LDDLIVGAVYADPNGNSSGKSYVVFGKANNSAINLSALRLIAPLLALPNTT
jgi:hypothetical protein